MSKIILILPSQSKYLKLAYNIPVKSDENTPLDLLIELGDFGISMIWISSKTPTIKGVIIYVFETNELPLEAIQKAFQLSSPASTNPSKVTISYNFTDSILVPKKYNHSVLHKEMLDLLFGEKELVDIKNEGVNEKGMYNVYRIPNAVEKVLHNELTITHQFHSSTAQIQKEVEGDVVYCIVFYDAIKILVYKAGRLQFLQQFKYAHPEDALYHLMNSCNQHGLEAAATPLKISGMIMEDSTLYKLIHHYFLDIELLALTSPLKMSDEIENVTPHFFSHLTELVSCAL